MADAPEGPAQAGRKKPAAGAANFPPLDVDVRSSTGPYPRPRPPRRGVRAIWLAAAGAAVVLGSTWFLFKSEEEQPPPLPPVTVPPVSLTRADPVPAEGVIDFAPVLDQPEDRPEPAADAPAQAAAPPKPAEKSVRATTPPKPAEKPVQTLPPQKPAQAEDEPEPADEPAQKMDEPSPPADQPAAEKSGTVEISDKWVVNIYSTPDATESLRFLSTLLGEDMGGRVYASEAVLEGRLQHRIRVGFFDTKEEAEAVGLKIKERYQLYSTPWAVKPSKEEENKFGGR